MKYRLMDILACPYDKSFPLRLIVFSERRYEHRQVKFKKVPACELYCGLKRKSVEELSPGEVDCEDCIKLEVVDGVLICERCKRWFPIRDEIPILLPDELRKRDEDLKFMQKYKDRFPEDVLREGRPFNLSDLGEEQS